MNNSIGIRFAKLVTHKKLFLFSAYTLMLLSSLGIIGQRFISDEVFVDNSISVWFNKNDPELNKFYKFQERFGEQEWSSIIIKTDSIFDEEFLQELRDVTNELEELPIVIRVSSLTNVRSNRVIDEDELWFTEILDEIEEHSSNKGEWLAQYKQRLNSNAFITRLLHNASDEQHTLIMLQSENRKDDPGDYRQQYYNDIYQILSARKTFKKVGFQGNAPLIVELNKAAVRDVFIFYNLTSLFLFMLGLLVFRNLRDTSVLVAMAMGVMTPAMAAIAAAGIPYNMMTQIMPVLLVAVATANVVHLIKEFHRNRTVLPNNGAMEKAISMLWTPGFWAAMTTVIGFASFIISDVRPISHIGIFGSIGILLGWLLSITIAPAILLYLYKDIPPPDTQSRNPGDTFIINTPRFIEKNKRIIIVLFTLFTLSLVGIKDTYIESDFTAFIGKSTPTRAAFDYTKSQKLAGSAVHLSLRFKQGNITSEHGRFKKIVELEKELSALAELIPDFHVVLGPGKMLWEAEKALSNNTTPWHEFADFSEGQIHDLILSSELSGNDQLSDFITEDKTQIRIALLTDYMGSETLHAFRTKIENIVSLANIEDAELIFTGNQVLLSNMDSHVATTQLYTLLIVLGFLIILLPLLFNSISLGLLGVIFNLFPLVFIYSLMAWLNIPINLATVIIGGVSLSLVVDDTIHFLSRFTQYRDMGYEWNRAVDETIYTIGHSVTLTSLILSVTFSVMMFSDYMPVRYFGLFISITVIMAWAMDLFLLPLLLKFYGRQFSENNTETIKPSN